MFNRKWGAWFETQQQQQQQHVDVSEEVNKDRGAGEEVTSLVQRAKGFSGYIYNFASSASKSLTESVVETAQTLKKSVEDGNIHGIIDKTLLGDFQKEQEKFVQEKNAKKFGAAVAPWVGSDEEETVQQQILALSADKRNFLREPPSRVHFHFDFEQMSPVAMVMLEEDELLRKMRFHLVPKQVNEEVFWRNYFYRVSLIKQSAQLAALAAQHQQEEEKKRGRNSEDPLQSGKVKNPASVCNNKAESSEDEVTRSPDSCDMNKDDLQQVLDHQDVLPDWERELQEELMEYDFLTSDENHDRNWDKEIEEMLKEEES